jgi:hypothetical protein
MGDLSLLASIQQHWQSQGWAPSTLASFRMEGPDLDAVLDGALGADTGDDDDDQGDEPAAKAAEKPVDTPDPFDTDATTFDRKYVEKLREENAKYRTERNQLRDEHGRFVTAFDGLDPELRDTFLQLPQAYRNDPVATARWMREQAEAILNGETDEPPAEKPLTRAEYDKLRQEERIAQDAQSILAQVTDLGYKPDSYEGRAFLAFALEQHGGDIAAAHTAVEAEKAATRKQAVDEYLNDKKVDARNTPSPVTGGSGTLGDKAPAINNINDAAKALKGNLDALFGGK